MIRLLHLADVHLGASFEEFGNLAPVRREVHLAAFARLPEIAARTDAQAVLIAGDLFDDPEPSREVRSTVLDTFERLAAERCAVFIVPGTHDASTLFPDVYRDPLAEAYVLKAPTFGPPLSVDTSRGPLHVYGICHDPSHAADPLSTFARSPEPGIHVALLHAHVTNSGRAQAPGITTLQVPLERLHDLDVDYLALGGAHEFVSPLKLDPNNRLPACIAGSFAALDATEIGARGFVTVELDEGSPPQAVHHSSGLAELLDIGDFDVTPYGTESQAAEGIADAVVEGNIPMVRLVGTPVFPLDPDLVSAELRARLGHAFVRDESSYVRSGRIEELGNRDTVLGHVVRRVTRRLEEADDEADREGLDLALRTVLRELGV